MTEEWRADQELSARSAPTILPPAWRSMKHAGTYARNDGLRVILSVERKGEGEPWLHVSASFASRLPAYKDMCQVKDIFIGRERKAIMVFAPEDEHINVNPNVHHLWSPMGRDPLPDFRRYGQL